MLKESRENFLKNSYWMNFWIIIDIIIALVMIIENLFLVAIEGITSIRTILKIQNTSNIMQFLDHNLILYFTYIYLPAVVIFALSAYKKKTLLANTTESEYKDLLLAKYINHNTKIVYILAFIMFCGIVWQFSTSFLSMTLVYLP